MSEEIVETLKTVKYLARRVEASNCAFRAKTKIFTELLLQKPRRVNVSQVHKYYYMSCVKYLSYKYFI